MHIVQTSYYNDGDPLSTYFCAHEKCALQRRNLKSFSIKKNLNLSRWRKVGRLKTNSQELCELENDVDKCFRLETSNSSINLWSETLAFAAANRWYSSNTEDRHHFCSFLKHPTRQPVRCWTNFIFPSQLNHLMTEMIGSKCFTFPLLQWISIGWLWTSAIEMRNCKDSRYYADRTQLVLTSNKITN